MPPIDNTEIGTPSRRRRRPLRSKTSDQFFRIRSLCASFFSDKDKNNVGPATNDHVPSDGTHVIPNNTSRQQETSMDETRMIYGTQEEGLFNKPPESAEHDLNISEKKEDLSHKVDTDRSSSVAITNQDNNHEMTSLSPHLYADKGTEEGEISGELMDLMLDDDTQFMENTVLDLEDLLATEPVVTNIDDLMPSFTETVEDVDKDMDGVVNKTTRSLVDYSELVVNGGSAKKVATEQVLPLKSILKNSATNHQDLVYSAKDASKEKKKKGPLTKERKAKKKRKDRIKRAEKNRKLGVKRLKIEPVVREKKVTYCRHYMKGRCHEGDKCKFSHDMVPLTKSKPCCHFARNACMKGDDCPFDHQLSKYPCNNHLTKGFCNRGSGCMFSHEAQPTESVVSNASNESKLEQKPPSNSGSKTIDTIIKSCSLPTSVTDNSESKLVKTTPSLSLRPPKGITFLSREKPPLESHPSPTVNPEVTKITKTPLAIQNTNEITKTTPVVPRGINFLSFGKKPSLDHSNIGNFIKMNNNATGKPQFGNLEGPGSGSKSESPLDAIKAHTATYKPNSFLKPMSSMLPFMSSASQKALQSTLDFASKIESGVMTKRL